MISKDDQIDELREQVLQLKEMLAPPTILFPPHLDLSCTEDALLRFFFVAPGGYRSWEHLGSFIEGRAAKESLQDPHNQVTQYLITLRRKMHSSQIELLTRYKMGIEMPLESRQRLAAIVRKYLNEFDWRTELSLKHTVVGLAAQ